LIPILNVEENICLPLNLDDKEADKATLDELITLLGLNERRKHLPSELSRTDNNKEHLLEEQ